MSLLRTELTSAPLNSLRITSEGSYNCGLFVTNIWWFTAGPNLKVSCLPECVNCRSGDSQFYTNRLSRLYSPSIRSPFREVRQPCFSPLHQHRGSLETKLFYQVGITDYANTTTANQHVLHTSSRKNFHWTAMATQLTKTRALFAKGSPRQLMRDLERCQFWLWRGRFPVIC